MQKLVESARRVDLGALRKQAEIASEIPHVNFYSLENEVQSQAFFTKLAKSLRLEIPKDAKEIGDLWLQAVKQGILSDAFDLQTANAWKTFKIEGLAGDYTRENDTLDKGVIVEYLWTRQDRRFVRTYDKDTFQKLFYSRNKYVISNEVMEKAKQTTVGIVGLSAGGMVGRLLNMTLPVKFVVCDAGRIDLTDLSRNPVPLSDVGEKQAIVWARSILERNPYTEIIAYPNFIGDGSNGTVPYDEFLKQIGEGGLVIEAIDSMREKYELRKKAYARGVQLIMPTDLGFGAAFQAEEQGKFFQGRFEVAALAALVGGKMSPAEKTRVAVQMVGVQNIPEHYARALQMAGEADERFWPQPGMSAYVSSWLAVYKIIKFLEGAPICGETAIDPYKIIG